jgi:Septum formation
VAWIYQKNSIRIIFILVVSAMALGAFVLRDRLSGDASNLAAGDCFDVPTTKEVGLVQHRPCSEPHDGEVILVGNHPAENGAPFPPENEFMTWAATNCLPAFNAYSGTDLADVPTVDVGVFRPTQDGWLSHGDRQIVCYAYPLPEGTSVTASFRGQATK